MFVMLPEPWKSIVTIAGPTIIALTLFIVGFFQGWWRTIFEVEVWKDRCDHAEHQVETLLPALHELHEMVKRLAEMLERK